MCCVVRGDHKKELESPNLCTSAAILFVSGLNAGFLTLECGGFLPGSSLLCPAYMGKKKSLPVTFIMQQE